MALGAIFADVLPDLEFAQPADNSRSDDEANKQSSEARESRAECQIAKDSERADVEDDETLLVKQPIEQISSSSCIVTLMRSNHCFPHPNLKRTFQTNAAGGFQ